MTPYLENLLIVIGWWPEANYVAGCTVQCTSRPPYHLISHNCCLMANTSLFKNCLLIHFVYCRMKLLNKFAKWKSFAYLVLKMNYLNELSFIGLFLFCFNSFCLKNLGNALATHAISGHIKVPYWFSVHCSRRHLSAFFNHQVTKPWRQKPKWLVKLLQWKKK